MPTKKKSKAKKSAAKTKKKAVKTSPRAAARKKPAAKKASPKRGAARTKVAVRRTPAPAKPARSSQRDEVRSGDSQGLSGRASADSQSVDELLDEGNAFEAEVVEGVEQADDEEMSEVHTHEVPEDDVPEEY